MNYVLAAAVLVVLAAAGFFILFRRLMSSGGNPRPSLDWCKEFSVAKYRPMERLFVEEDYDFLAAQPGYSPQIGRKLVVERRRIFRQYLACLSRDFERLHSAAKFLLLESPQDRPDLAIALLKQKLVFRYALAMVHCRLVLQTFGVGKVDVSGLVRPVEALRNHLQHWTPEVERSLA